MAYMNQERKAKLAANLKKVVPQGWKYSVSVQNHSTIVMTIASAPVDLIAEYVENVNQGHRAVMNPDLYSIKQRPDYIDVNHYWIDKQFSGETLEIFKQINEALNDGNHDRSDLMTDYFDVGWHVDIRIGRWDKPFQVH